ncbi:MAG: GNAT family N-acetyltransferase [Anaerolineales bacterium]|nr:GNAT family N-acetyltransferase [Anaerolineales bacterium]
MNDPIPELYRLRKKDIAEASAMLARAFREDPVWNAVFGAEATLVQREAVFSMPVRYCLKYGEVFAASEKLEGMIGWTPGEQAEMTAWRLIRCGGILSGMKIGSVLSSRMGSIFRQLTLDQKEQLQGGRFLYVQILGVEPAHQGKGIGRRLIGELIEAGRRQKRSVYLETETERNVAMYEKYGFRLIRTITLPAFGLPMYEMIRDPL